MLICQLLEKENGKQTKGKLKDNGKQTKGKLKDDKN